MRKAIVLLSGGQDSTTALYWAKYEAGYDCHAIGFDYGQRHARAEIAAAKKIARIACVDYTLLPVGAFKALGDSDLVKPGNGFDEREDGLPTSFVPGRNILFLSIAGAFAKKTGAEAIVAGFCETDYSGYPDCRSQFVAAMDRALGYGLDMPELHIETPLMYRDKADTFALAHCLGVLDIVLADSVTCYEGVAIENEYGKGCGVCPACILRKNGYAQFLEGLNG